MRRTVDHQRRHYAVWDNVNHEAAREPGIQLPRWTAAMTANDTNDARLADLPRAVSCASRVRRRRDRVVMAIVNVPHALSLRAFTTRGEPPGAMTRG